MLGDPIISIDADGTAHGASGRTYSKVNGAWYTGSDGKSYRIANGQAVKVDNAMTAPTIQAAPVVNAGNVGKFMVAAGVLATVTLALPKRWGVYVPWLVLFSYTAYKSGVVNNLLAATIGGNQQGSGIGGAVGGILGGILN